VDGSIVFQYETYINAISKHLPRSFTVTQGALTEHPTIRQYHWA